MNLVSPARPLRVAIIGSGPAGFYAAEALLKREQPRVEVDMFERLPTPFGLVRSGVAPDHQKIKRAAEAFERTALSARYRFLGNVTVGHDIGIDELLGHYDQVVVATGSAVDRRLGVPGEDLHGSHPATAFVGWYNAHPDFAGESFDLGTERAVVVGVGNVALDVTRVLIRNPEELAPTDVAGYALDALRKSSVREVVVLGRRGPAQAAFDLSELIDIVELDGVEVVADPSQIDPESASDPRLDRAAKKKVAYLAELAKRHPSPSAGLLGPGQRRVRLEFLCSPLEIIGNEGRVESMRVERNRLVASNGDYKARGTGEIFSIETGLVFRSIGYHGVIVPGLPFDAQRGVIPNLEGRVTDETGQLVPRVYVVGWIKRGPTGVIGTNKPDAQQTVRHMLADAEALDLTYDDQKTRAAMDVLLESRGVVIADYLAWRRLDDLEKAAGLGLGKVREKFSSVRAMLEALARK